MNALAIALMIEFLKRLPDILEAIKDEKDITLADIFPITRAEREASIRRRVNTDTDPAR